MRSSPCASAAAWARRGFLRCCSSSGPVAVVPAKAGTHTPQQEFGARTTMAFAGQRRPVVMGPGLRRDDTFTGGSDGSRIHERRAGVSRGSAVILPRQRAAGYAAQAGRGPPPLEGRDGDVWRILNKKGWGVSHWPKQYGGTGWTSVQHYI